jgi:hypothetical protein
MNISNIYVYFNRNGELVCKAPYVDTGSIRQGDDFLLNVLFDKGSTTYGDVLGLMFKVPTEENYNLFPFLGQNSVNISKQIDTEFTFVYNPNGFRPDKDLSNFGIYKDVEYDCWTFDSSSVYDGKALLTNVDGNLEVQIIKYSNSDRSSYTRYAGTFNIFIEKTAHYKSEFDVKQADLDRYIEETKDIALEQAKVTTIDILPEHTTNVETTTFVDKNGETRTESLTFTFEELSINEKNEVVSTKTNKTVEMPLPLVEEEINVTSSHEIEEQTATVTGTGKEKDPLTFSLNLHKARDGYGIHFFYIDEETGELMVNAENSDDLVDENYQINDDGELVIKF